MNSFDQTELTQKPRLFPQKYSPFLRSIIEEFDPLLQEPEDTFGILLNQLLTRIEAQVPTTIPRENPSNSGLIPRNGKRNSRNNRQHNQAIIFQTLCQKRLYLSQQ